MFAESFKTIHTYIVENICWLYENGKQQMLVLISFIYRVNIVTLYLLLVLYLHKALGNKTEFL